LARTGLVVGEGAASPLKRTVWWRPCAARWPSLACRLPNDRTESVGLCRVFGEGLVPPVSSTKPITGHCLGATPGLEAIIAIRALQSGRLPPTANLTAQDPDCRIEVIWGQPASLSHGSVLSTSLGFWAWSAR
jgi:3-oxoacyl-(acyl-carrier-protein) synthase